MDLKILADVVCRACRIELLRNPDALLRRRERKQLLVGMPWVGPQCAVRFTRERGRRFNDLIHSDRVAMQAERSAFLGALCSRIVIVVASFVKYRALQMLRAKKPQLAQFIPV